ncbi:hypothetical protein ACJRO7_009810 [Eucalyptus globulus]|uniref:MADS-box domain-containing protein n=1 Tax=Eucalyptus globulus TaxID=34317 RepID=A0ABD3LDH8_EUCGL
MPRHPSPSLPPRKPRNAPAPAPAPAVSLPPSEKHSPTVPSSTVQRRQTKVQRIENPRKRSQKLCKWGQTLLRKTKDLHIFTGAQVALVIISPSGKRKDSLRSVGEPSVEGVFSEFLRREGIVKLPMCPKEWLDCAEKECDSCNTKEDYASLIMKCENVLNFLREKWRGLEDDTAVNEGAGDDSGVGVGAGNDFKILNSDEINSTEKNCETTRPSFVAFNEDSVDRDISLTSPADLATTGGESLAMDSTPMLSNIEDMEPLLDRLAELAKDPDVWTPPLEESARSDHEDFLSNEWMGLENNSSVNAGAAHESGVGAGRDREGSTNYYLHSMIDDLKVSDPEIYEFFEPYDSAANAIVLGERARSDHEWMDLENNPYSGVGVGRDPEGLKDGEIDALRFALKNSSIGVGCHNLSTPPVDSAAGGESSGMDFEEFCNHLGDITNLPKVD